MKIFMRSNSSEDLGWISSKNLVNIFRRKNFKASKNLHESSSKDLQTISDENLFDIFERFSIRIFLRSTEDLLVFVLIFDFEKNFSNNQKWSENLMKVSKRTSNEIF